VNTSFAQRQQALSEQIGQVREKIGGLQSQLHAIDRELDGMSGQRQQFQWLGEACDALNKLNEIGAASAFWGEELNGYDPNKRLAEVSHSVGVFRAKLDEIETGRLRLLTEINSAQDQLYDLNESLEEVREAEESAKWDFVITREERTMPFRPMVMPWTKQGEDQRRFRRVLLACLLLLLMFGTLPHFWTLPVVDKTKVEIPERLAKMIEKKVPPKPVEKKKEEPKKEEEKKEEKKEEKPKPAAPKPAAAPKPKKTKAHYGAFGGLMDDSEEEDEEETTPEAEEAEEAEEEVEEEVGEEEAEGETGEFGIDITAYSLDEFVPDEVVKMVKSAVKEYFGSGDLNEVRYYVSETSKIEDGLFNFHWVYGSLHLALDEPTQVRDKWLDALPALAEGADNEKLDSRAWFLGILQIAKSAYDMVMDYPNYLELAAKLVNALLSKNALTLDQLTHEELVKSLDLLGNDKKLHKFFASIATTQKYTGEQLAQLTAAAAKAMGVEEEEVKTTLTALGVNY